jgi:hypothetical protein
MAKKKRKSTRDPRKKQLTPQQSAAVMARAKPGCTNIAALLEGYPKAKNWTESTSRRYASDLFKKPHVAYALEREHDKLRSKGRRKTALSAQDVINEFKYLAFSSITDVVQYEKKMTKRGVEIYVMKITEFDKLSDESKRAIKNIKIRTKPVKHEDAEGDLTWHEIQEIEFQMLDKQKALDSLAKYFDLYVEKLEVHHTGTIGVVHTTAQEMRVLFDAMTPDERAEHLDKLMDDEAVDVTNEHEAKE